MMRVGKLLVTAQRGPKVKLAPGEMARVGEIVGWEWDSVLKLDIQFRNVPDGELRQESYDLKTTSRTRHIVDLGEVYEVEPFALKAFG